MKHHLRWLLLGFILLASLACTPYFPSTSAAPTLTATAELKAPTQTPVPPTMDNPTHTLVPTQTNTPQPPSTPTASTTPTTEPSPAPPVEAPTDWSLALWESELVLNTYGWEAALIPTETDDPIYPYPRLDPSAVGPAAARAYHAVILENGYTRVTVLPEMGGRIIRWEDKLTGRTLTYANPVIKPTAWGYRGWWLGSGGIEWAFPTDEHGLNEWRPWQYELLSGDGWRGVRLWDTDARSGLDVEVTLKLIAGRSDLLIAPRISNATATPQSFQFWINAMLTLSDDNTPAPSLRFWVPTTEMLVHSTADGGLPAPGEKISWPLYNGRDFSRYTEWSSYLGLFATQAQGAVAAYDTAIEQGMVRTYPGNIASGVKIFCLGDLPAALYTDDNSRYFELWGGYTRTFWDNAQLAAAESVSWEEYWYPVHDIGNVNWANGEMAVALLSTEQGLDIGVYAPRSHKAHLILNQNGNFVAAWDITAGPGMPFRTLHPATGTGWELQIWQADMLLAQIGASQ